LKKIAILGIAAATVLAVGIFANIGLFSINALAAEPTTEQKIKIIFRQIINPEFGLKEIKNEVRAIEEALQDKATIVCDSDNVTGVDVKNNDLIVIKADSTFKLNAVYVDMDTDSDVLFFIDSVTADGNTFSLGIPGSTLLLGLFTPEGGSLELLRMSGGRSLLFSEGDFTGGVSLADLPAENVSLKILHRAELDTEEDLLVTACAWIAQSDKTSFDVEIVQSPDV